jgi:hypothetical protein
MIETADRQPDSHAAGLGGEEGLEQPPRVLRVNPDAGVLANGPMPASLRKIPCAQSGCPAPGSQGPVQPDRPLRASRAPRPFRISDEPRRCETYHVRRLRHIGSGCAVTFHAFRIGGRPRFYARDGFPTALTCGSVARPDRKLTAELTLRSVDVCFEDVKVYVRPIHRS